MRKDEKNLEYEQILWKYYSARRKDRGILFNSSLEIADFLFKEALPSLGRPESVESFRFPAEYQSGILTQEEEALLRNNCKDVIESFCKPNHRGTTHFGDAMVPSQIIELAASFLPQSPNGCYYNPFSGFASFPIARPDLHFEGCEISEETWALSMLRLMAHGVSADLYNSDYINYSANRKYDGIACFPPFGMKKSMAIEQIVDSLYGRLQDNGVLSVVVPAKYIADSCPNSIREMRDKIILERAISQVILLPEKLLFFSNLQIAIIVIEKRNHNSIVFTDASQATLESESQGRINVLDISGVFDGSRAASIETPYTLVDSKGSLDPEVYISMPAIGGQRLHEYCPLCETFEPDYLGNGLKYIGTTDLTREFARDPLNSWELQGWNSRTNLANLVFEPAFLIAYNVRDSALSFGYIENIPECGIVVANDIAIFTMPEGVDVHYLMVAMKEQIVQKQLSILSRGRHFISSKDLAQIVLPDHSKAEQDQLVMEALRKSMSTYERELEGLRLEYEGIVRERKHALSQSVSSLSSLWNVLDTFRKANGSICGTDLIGRSNPMSVDKLCDSIAKSIADISTQVLHIADTEEDWGDDGPNSLVYLLTSYAENNQSPDFAYILSGYIDDKSDLQFKKAAESLENSERNAEDILSYMEEHIGSSEVGDIDVPEKALYRILDNIVSNARYYGFGDKNRADFIIAFDWYEEDGNAVILVSNNGAPLAEDADASMILVPGYSTSLHKDGHFGGGGAEIASLAKKFGGTASVISSPDEEYTITYKLRFPLVRSTFDSIQ